METRSVTNARSWSHDGIVALLRPEVVGSGPLRPYERLEIDDRRPVPSPANAEAPATLFVALAGTRYDSHRSLPALAERGFAGAVGEAPPPPGLALPYYRVPSSARALALLAQAFADFPGRALRLFGVTGTNGKSTTVRLLAGILEAAGRSTGWSGTVSSRLGGAESASRMTTPPAIDLAREMAEFRDRGGQDFVLEVSSHALAQRRTDALPWAAATFTSLSRDHFDYHGSVDAYLAAKLRLLEGTGSEAPVVVPWSAGFPREAFAGRDVLWFSADDVAGPLAARPVHVEFSAAGVRGEIELLGERLEIESPLLGRHNLSNLLAAALTARACGVDAGSIVRGLRATEAVRGRLQAVPGSGGQVYVDYAHTPDALRALLTSLRELAPSRLTVVFGCGGDRDRGKRPEMGGIAWELADRVVVTSDNPRSEVPQSIIDEVLTGIDRSRHRDRTLICEVDRREAIRIALEGLEEREPRAVGEERRDQEIIVVAGKGHEATQEISGEKIPFDDFHVIRELLRHGARDGSTQ